MRLVEAGGGDGGGGGRKGSVCLSAVLPEPNGYEPRRRVVPAARHNIPFTSIKRISSSGTRTASTLLPYTTRPFSAVTTTIVKTSDKYGNASRRCVPFWPSSLSTSSLSRSIQKRPSFVITSPRLSVSVFVSLTTPIHSLAYPGKKKKKKTKNLFLIPR